MFCINCGNKLDDKACVCINCGVIVRNRSEIKVVKQRKKVKINNKILGIVSIVFGVISLMVSLMSYLHDISSVGMYTEIGERVMFALDYSITAILLSIVTLIFSLISKKNIYGKTGFMLSLLSLFFIITEFIVVIIY